MPISNASRLADFSSGIGTAGAIIQVDNINQRVGIGTTNPKSTLQVGIGVTIDGTSGIISARGLSIGGQIVSSLGVGIRTAGGTVGTGATILDLRGAGISTVTVSSGIATININLPTISVGGTSVINIGGTSPGTPYNSFQYNNNGTFGGVPLAIYDDINNKLNFANVT